MVRGVRAKCVKSEFRHVASEVLTELPSTELIGWGELPRNWSWNQREASISSMHVPKDGRELSRERCRPGGSYPYTARGPAHGR